MKVSVDKNLCVGCGACIALCPEVFQYGSDGKSEVKKNSQTDKNKDCAVRAASVCPVQAIKVE